MIYSTHFGLTTESNSFTYIKCDQIIDFPVIPIQMASNIVGLSASASSGLPVSFQVLSGPAIIINDTNLSFIGGGPVSVVALQAGNSYWAAAANVTNTFNVLLPMTVSPDNGPSAGGMKSL